MTDQPRIPPKGHIASKHRIDRVEFGFDVVIQVRSLEKDMSELEVLGMAWANLSEALENAGVDLQYGLDNMLDRS